MARQIVWSRRAQKDRRAILEYWIQRNNSTAYSRKLDALLREAVKLISEFPLIGSPTNVDDVRIKSVGDYLIFYVESQERIHVLTIWDRRRDPEKLKLT